MNYVKEVADLYLALNPTKPILEGADYTIIAEWEKEEIPPFVVRSSIEEVCHTLSSAGVEIDSLEYVRHAVKESYSTWLQEASVG